MSKKGGKKNCDETCEVGRDEGDEGDDAGCV